MTFSDGEKMLLIDPADVNLELATSIAPAAA
jgi:hypothetical protein